MMTVSIAELRQNPNPAFDAVARGEEVVVTRYRRPIGRIVPEVERRSPSGAEIMELVRGWEPLPGPSLQAAVLEARRLDDAEAEQRWPER